MTSSNRSDGFQLNNLMTFATQLYNNNNNNNNNNFFLTKKALLTNS